MSGSKFQLSLCIATMDRWDFLKNTLPKYLDNPYIAEIVISDENGNDAKFIQAHFDNPKIKISINETRLGGFRNKRMAVSKATNTWVCLADSDNFLPLSYFEAAAEVFDPSDINMIYSPSFTFPTENHPGFNWRHMNNDVFTPENYKQMWDKYKNNNNINVGNYIVSKELYMRAEHPNDGTDYDTSCRCLDALYQNYLIFKNGGSFRTIPGMEYYHAVHPGSYYMKESAITNTRFFEDLFI
jgi:hypothetical protein